MELKKSRRSLAVSIAGLVFTVAVIVYFSVMGDSRATGFYLILVGDIIVIVKDLKRYRAAKNNMDIPE